MSAKALQIFALIGISLGAFMAFMDFTIVSAALPSIQSELQLSLVQLEWVMNAFLICYCVFMATMGRMADIKGPRFMLYISLILFALGCIIDGASQTWSVLVFGRALQG